MNQKAEKKRNPLWLDALIALGLLFVFVVVILMVAIPLGYYAYDAHMSSLISIQSWSGSDVRFDKVILDDHVLWAGHDIVVESKKNLEKPWLDPRGRGPMPRFRAPKKLVELKIVLINEIQERETVSCTLDNRSRPCFFEVHYKKGRLSCSDCEGLTEAFQGRKPEKCADKKITYCIPFVDCTRLEPAPAALRGQVRHLPTLGRSFL